MRTEGLDAREATRRTMQEVTGPLIAIVLVLTAVFLPVAFLGGLIGEIYRQFAITISASVIISGFVALTLTPALCALLIKPAHSAPPRLLSLMQQRFDGLTARSTRGAGFFMRHGGRAIIVIVLMPAVTAGLCRPLPAATVAEDAQDCYRNAGGE